MAELCARCVMATWSSASHWRVIDPANPKEQQEVHGAGMLVLEQLRAAIDEGKRVALDHADSVGIYADVQFRGHGLCHWHFPDIFNQAQANGSKVW